jgi:hypothetical protein
MRRWPAATATVVTAAKAVGADALIQTYAEGAEELDLRRSALFCTFGCTYQGIFQYWM